MNKYIMERSLSQLSTSYAPGALFTFEGGSGGYLCVGKPAMPIGQEITPYASSIIFTQIEELAQNWLGIAECADAEYTRPQDCLDETFLKNNRFFFNPNQIALVKPGEVGFEPMPTVFYCERCHVVSAPWSEECPDIVDIFKQIKKLKKPTYKVKSQRSQCGTSGCKWKQLDVVFIHPNGAILPGRPGKYDKNGFKPPKCSNCGSKEFVIDKSSPKIGQWKYNCAECGLALTGAEWRQNETSIINYYANNDSTESQLTGPQLMHARMFPVPYLSNTVFYPKTGSALDFNDQDSLTPDMLLDEEVLKRKLATLLGVKSSLSVEELITQAKGDASFTEIVNAYERAKTSIDMLKTLPSSNAVEAIMAEQLSIIDVAINKLRSQFGGGDLLPPKILCQVNSRPQWLQKYDPIRLLFEHAALSKSILDTISTAGERRKFVPFDNILAGIDDDFAPTAPDTPATDLNAIVANRMQAIGIHRAGLIREIGVLNYSYGFSRVSPLPTHTRRQGKEPVKLNLFKRIQVISEAIPKHPVYVQQSKNEALYFQLDSVRVSKWLQSLGATNVPTDQVALRQYLLEEHKPISTFVDNVVPTDGQLQPYMAAYTLLHTFSHQVMHMVAELSGLEISSLGEYLFPLDMAVLIYRNGTTQDLGNFSSLWRNQQIYLFDYLMEQNTLRCSSGTLCDNRGGACPGCILLPETSCVACNRLLSRGALSGKGRTKEAGINAFQMSYFNP